MDDYEFVEKDTWHQENPNKQAPEVDIHNIDGKDTEGYWIKLGPRGHHKFRKYEDRGVEQRTELESVQKVDTVDNAGIFKPSYKSSNNL